MSVTWTPAGEYSDIRYELSGDGIAKITIDRPEVRNAFRPQTVVELSDAFERALLGLVREHMRWRRGFHPEDPPSITSADQAEPSFAAAMGIETMRRQVAIAAIRRDTVIVEPPELRNGML